MALSRQSVAALCIAMLVTSEAIGAQVVTPRTIPVLQQQQYDIFPSQRGGMAGVAIAVDDTLLDAFTNPAKATRIRSSWLSVAPVFAGSNDRGSGRTIPLGVFGEGGNWGYAGLFAMQELQRPSLGFTQTVSDRSAVNHYIVGSLGRRLPGGLALGGGAYLADLAAQIGVDQLYFGSDRVRQRGRVRDFRLGLTKEGTGGTAFELVGVRSNFRMTHDVHFPQALRWSPGPPWRVDTLPESSQFNVDETNLWGAHAEFSRPIGTLGWRVGWLATVNRHDHPKIPDYRLPTTITVPRDPGHTWAYNVGVGAARTVGRATFALDLVLEPMFSTTWAEAARDTAKVGGGTIPAGGHTVDNTFRFSNALIRVGLENALVGNRDSTAWLGWQIGLSAYTIRYTLEQADLVRGTVRDQREAWTEWSPTFGLRWRARDMEIAYTFSLTCGAGGDCIDPCFIACSVEDMPAAPPGAGGGGVIAAPTSSLVFDAGRVTVQRLAFSFRIR